MGGRGAASGISDKGKKYGTEFSYLLKVSNVKFVRYNESNNAKDPLETMTKGRIYATINDRNEINSINYYDSDGKKVKSINLLHNHEEIKGEHTHEGYYHKERGTRHLTTQEKKLVDIVKRAWYNRKSVSA